MIDKNRVETILKINGLASSSPDEKIRAVLLSASFNEDEVKTAMMILRENTKTNQTRIDGLHKVFRTNMSLKSSEISALLGIDVNIPDKINVKKDTHRYSLFQVILLWFASMLVAATAILLYMYSQHIGFFHPASEIFIAFKNV